MFLVCVRCYGVLDFRRKAFYVQVVEVSLGGSGEGSAKKGQF